MGRSIADLLDEYSFDEILSEGLANFDELMKYESTRGYSFDFETEEPPEIQEETNSKKREETNSNSDSSYDDDF